MKSIWMLAVVNLLWALQFPAARTATQELGPLTLTWFAMLLSVAVVIPIALREGIPSAETWRRCLPSVLALGLSGSLVAQLCLNWGLESVPASNAAVMNLSIPILMTLLAAILLGERMSPRSWIAFSISLPGVMLASDIRWSETRFFEGRMFWGNVLLFLSCCGSAFYNIFSKRALDWLGPAQLLVTTFLVSLGALLPAMLYYEPGVEQRFRNASSGAIWGLGIVGVVSLAAATLLYFHLLSKLNASQISLSIYLLPIFGVLVSGAALQETLSPSLLAGGAMVAVGAWIVTAQQPEVRPE